MAASTPKTAKADEDLGQILELGEHLVMDGAHADIVVQAVDLLHITGEVVGIDLDEQAFRILRCGKINAPDGDEQEHQQRQCGQGDHHTGDGLHGHQGSKRKIGR
jgi:hypothetical protein